MREIPQTYTKVKQTKNKPKDYVGKMLRGTVSVGIVWQWAKK